MPPRRTADQDQVKLQNALDSQLGRLRRLSDFALECSSLEDPVEILERAVRLLRTTFQLTKVTAIFTDDDQPRRWIVHPSEPEGPRVIELKADALKWARRLEQTQLFELKSGRGNAQVVQVLDALDSSAGGTDRAGHSVLCIPLHPTRDCLTGVIVAYEDPESGDQPYKEHLHPVHLPFFKLLANHLERAMQNSVLTSELRRRGEELSEANDQLTASLENLQQAQQQLLQAQKMDAVGRLAGGVAHDFNNLLTVILSRADLLGQELPAGGTETVHLSEIVDAGNRAAKITGQLLAFSRKQRHTPEDVDLNTLAMEMARMLGRLIGEHLSLDLRLDPAIDTIRADRAQLEQIFMNLVLNARDASCDGGVITIQTRRATVDDVDPSDASFDTTNCIAIVVSDTGHGMSETTRRQIFEPFFTTKELGQGTGLGLATVYGLVQQHGGHISVESQVGRGSCFTVLIPVTNAAESARAAAAPAVSPEPKLTILLAEDEDAIRSLAGCILRDQGYDVIEARDGRDALDIAARHEGKIDLLLTDVVMPHIGGIDLAERLRDEFPGMPVLYMSGYTFDVEGDWMPGESGESFLAKPFAPEEFMLHVRKSLELPREER